MRRIKYGLNRIRDINWWQRLMRLPRGAQAGLSLLLMLGLVLSFNLVIRPHMGRAIPVGCFESNNIFDTFEFPRVTASPITDVSSRWQSDCAAAPAKLWASHYTDGTPLEIPNSTLKVYYADTQLLPGLIDTVSVFDYNSPGCALTAATVVATISFERFMGGNQYDNANWQAFSTQTVTPNGNCNRTFSATIDLGSVPGRINIASQQYGLVRIRVQHQSQSLNNSNFRVNSVFGAVSFAELDPAETATAYGTAGNDGVNAANNATGSGTRQLVQPAPLNSEGAFGLWTPQTAGRGQFDKVQYSLLFAPDCNYVASYGNRMVLRWYDADSGTPGTQDGTISFRVVDLTTGADIASAVGAGVLGQDDQYRELVVNGLVAGRSYLWLWDNVQRNNGIQIWMPFSERAGYLIRQTGCAPPPQATASCINLSLSNVEVGRAVDVRIGFTVASPTGTPPINNGQNAFRVNSSTIPTYTPGTINFSAVTPPGGTIEATRSTTFASAGTYTIQWQLEGPNLAGPPPIICNGTVTVVATPYLKLYGADVWAGGGFSDASDPSAACTNLGPGTIQTFRRTSGGVGGSSVEFAALALGQIQQFYSASQRPEATSGTTPMFLTFANNVPADGGNFGSQHCIPDYYEVTKDRDNLEGPYTNQTTLSVSGLLDNTQYEYVQTTNAPLVLTSLPNFNKRLTVYVTGNVRINSDIRYPAGNYSTRDQIPYFTLIVRGNILIDPSVTHLDGLYISQPDDTLENGRILTCYDDSVGITNADLSRNLPTAPSCNSNLVIQGALVSREVRFLRWKGNVGVSNASEYRPYSDNIAEVVQFMPELFVGAPVFNQPSSAIYSIAGLPPVF